MGQRFGEAKDSFHLLTNTSSDKTPNDQNQQVPVGPGPRERTVVGPRKWCGHGSGDGLGTGTGAQLGPLPLGLLVSLCVDCVCFFILSIGSENLGTGHFQWGHFHWGLQMSGIAFALPYVHSTCCPTCCYEPDW
jgi:hypothetical protein